MRRAALSLASSMALLAVVPAAFAQEAAAPPWRRAPRHAAPPAPTVEIEDFTHDAEGRVTLLLESAGRPQRVIFEQRRPEAPPQPTPAASERTTQRTSAPLHNILGSGTCTTPCVLHVPPGALVVRTEGTGLRRVDMSYDVAPTDARITFRAASQAQWNVGVGLVAVGSTVLLAIAGLGLLSQTSGGPDLPTAPVIGVSLGGAALLAVGIPLLALNTTGVARSVAIAPR